MGESVAMLQSEARRRRDARDAFQRLPNILLQTRFASSVADAIEMTDNFSSAFKIERSGNDLARKSIVSKLVSLLESGESCLDHQCAVACVAFLSHRSLTELARDLTITWP
jgi:hypothetical protein